MFEFDPIALIAIIYYVIKITKINYKHLEGRL